MADDLDDVRNRLDSLAEDLADLAMDRLRRAIDDGDPGAAALEKRLTRARRAIEKASHLLAEQVDER